MNAKSTNLTTIEGAKSVRDQVRDGDFPVDHPKGHGPRASGSELIGMVGRDPVAAYRMAEALSKAGDMVPESYRGKPDAVFAAMVKGEELGFGPMQSLSAIAVVNGRPSVWGDALRAVVQRAGHHIDCEVTGEGKDAVATATLTRANGRQIVRTFSMKDAEKAQLAGKRGPWTQYPKRMLMNRATAFAVRDGAADCLMGMSVGDGSEGPDQARDVTPEHHEAPRPSPRSGGAVYVDPDADEIYEHEEAQEPEGDIDPETGEVLPPVDPELLELAGEAADQGREGFIQFWKTLNKDGRAQIKPRIHLFEARAKQADERARDAELEDDDPFGGGGGSPDPGAIIVRTIAGKLDEAVGEDQVRTVLEAFAPEIAELEKLDPDRHREVLEAAEAAMERAGPGG